MNNLFTVLLLVSPIFIIFFIIQALINLIRKRSPKKSFMRSGISAMVLIISIIGFDFTYDSSSAENDAPDSETEITQSEDSEQAATELASYDTTDLFEQVYLPYANREKSFEFFSVKEFAESTDYVMTTTESSEKTPKTITLTAENGDYVFFRFKNIEYIWIIMTVSYYQTSSESEVSLNNYSGYNSYEDDIYMTHVIDEPITRVRGIQEQLEFLFGK